MKLIFLIVTFILALHSFGQITLTRSNYTEAGDTIRINNASGVLPSYQAAGSNQIWNFSALTLEEESDEITYKLSAGGMIINFQFGSFAPPKYQADMIQEYNAIPFDQISQFLPIEIPIEGVNRILKTNEDKVEIVGYSLEASGQQLGFRSETIETSYSFPINYLDTFHTSGYTEFDLNPLMDIQLNQERNRTSVVDAYGTIRTPHNTYHNVLRITHRTVENNEVKVPIGDQPVWIPFQRTIHEYEWWSTEFKRPVFKIEEESVFGFSTSTKITFVHDPQPPYVHLGVGLFPNPATDLVVLKTDEEIEKVLVYNLEGKLVEDISLISAQNFCEIDLKNLRSGRYTVVAITKENKQSFPLIVL